MKGFPKDLYLYNFAAAKSTTAPFIFLVEGAPDVFRLAEAGYVGVALLGSDASDAQLEKLADIDREIWVAFDNDDAGMAAIRRFTKKAGGYRIRIKSIAAPQPFKDLGETPIEELRRAIRQRVRELADLDALPADPDFDGIPFDSPEEALEKVERRLRDHEDWLRKGDRARTPNAT